MLMYTTKKDVRSVTGGNYRNIMLLLGKTSIDYVKKEDVEKIEYFPLDETKFWKVNATKEIIDVKNKQLDIENFQTEEIEEMLTFLCTS